MRNIDDEVLSNPLHAFEFGVLLLEPVKHALEVLTGFVQLTAEQAQLVATRAF